MPNIPQNAITPEQLGYLKSKLQEEQQWLQQKLEDDDDHMGLDDSLRVQTGELSAYDNHPADLGTEMFERSKDIALNENRERHLIDVNEALQRMDSGGYGRCVTCGASISFERLEAIPTTLYCIEHVPDPHASERRPVEEKLLAPPFGRSSLDEKNNQTEFDGEDAWQIVESWGTSNTPAMAENPNVSSDYDDMEIEADEHVGYVESFESFLATDMYGQHVTVVRNKAYRDYMNSGEGEGLLENDESYYDGDAYS